MTIRKFFGLRDEIFDGAEALVPEVQVRQVDAEAAFAAAQLDEGYQIERWGDDAEAVRRRDAIKNDLDAAARFIDLLKG